MGYNRPTNKMKKILLCSVLIAAPLCGFAQARESAVKIAETVNPNYCTTSDGQSGTLRRTSSTTTTTTSTSNSSNRSSGYSNSSSTSTSASAGFSGLKPEASISGSKGTSSSNNQSQSTGNSSTSTTTRQDNYQCYPYKR